MCREYLHRLDARWVMRPDERARFWDGETKPFVGGLSIVHTGGHFDGFQAPHWPAGAGGKGVLLAGDQPAVRQNRRWVTFMWSYPKMIPPGPAAIRKIATALRPIAFDRLDRAFSDLVVMADAKAAAERSAARYLRVIEA
jgi:hypothetical protein